MEEGQQIDDSIEISKKDDNSNSLESFKKAFELTLLFHSRASKEIMNMCYPLQLRIDTLAKNYNYLFKNKNDENEDKKDLIDYILSKGEERKDKYYKIFIITFKKDDKSISDDLIKFYNYILIKNIYENKNEKIIWNVVLDEAHKYIKNDSKNNINEENDLDNIYKKVIKEGRKKGIFLTLISQQLIDIPNSILSQLNMMFLHRLKSSRDLEILNKSMSSLNEYQIKRMPFLGVGNYIFLSSDILFPLNLIIDEFKGGNEKSETPYMWKKTSLR